MPLRSCNCKLSATKARHMGWHADFEHSFVAEAHSKVIPGFSSAAGVESSAGFLDEKRFLSIRLDMHARVGSLRLLHTRAMPMLMPESTHRVDHHSLHHQTCNFVYVMCYVV